MSSHEISVYTPFSLKLGEQATVQSIVDIVNAYLGPRGKSVRDEKGDDQRQLAVDVERFEAIAEDEESYVLIKDGLLDINLLTYGPGHGAVSDDLNKMAQALSHELLQGGLLVMADHHLSPGSEEGLMPVFIARDAREVRLAAVAYGLHLASDFIKPHIGAGAWNQLASTAMSKAEEGAPA